MGCLTKQTHGTFDPIVVRAFSKQAKSQSQIYFYSKQSLECDRISLSTCIWICAEKNTLQVASPDSVTLHGWAWSETAAKGGSIPISVQISVDGAVSTTIANVSRPDLVAAHVAPNNYHGFEVTVSYSNAMATVHQVDVVGIAPNGDKFALNQSPRCFNSTAECPCS